MGASPVRLTARQARFVDAYLACGNLCQAAREAGASERGANSAAQRWATNPAVRAEIERRQAEVAKKYDVTFERVVRELAAIAFTPFGDLAEWGPDGVTLKAKDKLSDEALRSVAEVSETVTEKGGSLKIRQHDKIAALEKLAKHVGLFKDTPASATVVVIDPYAGSARPKDGA